MRDPVLIDVDGTILTLDQRRHLRPGISQLLEALSLLGHRTVVWSKAGDEYAQFHCERYGLQYFIDSYMTKPEMTVAGIIDSLEGCTPLLQIDNDPYEHPVDAEWPFQLI